MSGNTRKALTILEVYGLYFLTGAVCLCFGASFPFLQEHLHLSIGKTALLGSSYAIGRVAAVPVFGRLADRYGTKPCMAYGYFAFFLQMMFLPQTKTLLGAMTLMAIGGSGMATQDAACPSVIRMLYPNSYAGAMSSAQALFSAGTLFSPIFLTFLLSMGGSWQGLYFGIGTMSFLLLAILPFSISAVADDFREEHTLFTKSTRKMLYLLFGITFFYCAVVNVCYTYTNSYFLSLGYGEVLAANILTALSVGQMVGCLFFAWVLKRIHPVRILLVNSFFTLLFLAAGLWCSSIWIKSVAFFLSGFFDGVLFSILVTLIVTLRPSVAALASAAIGFVGGGSDIVTPWFTGKLADGFGVGSTLFYALLAAILVVVSAVYFHYLWREKEKKDGSIPGDIE